MLIVTTLLYIVSISLALLLAPFENFNKEESPFVTALHDLKFSLLIQIFNGVLIIAGFSSLVASLFSVTQMMYTIAKDGDAPKLFCYMSKRKMPYGSLGLTVCGMLASIVTALALPKGVYEYITTAGGLMLIYAWLFILFSSRKLLKQSLWGHIKTIFAVGLILLAAAGTLFDPTSRPGFYASVICLVLIGAVTLFMNKLWNKGKPASNQHINRLDSKVKAKPDKRKAGST
jgi:L-asparagine transporter-like permease